MTVQYRNITTQISPDANHFGGLKNAIYNQERRPPDGDRIIQSLWRVTRNLLDQRRAPALNESLKDFVATRGVGSTMSYANGLGIVRSALQVDAQDAGVDFREVLTHGDSVFENSLLELDELLGINEGTQRADTFLVNLSMRQLSTNVSERYKTVDVLSKLLAARYPDGIRMLDIGCGVLQGVRHLALQDDIPFGNTTVVQTAKRHNKSREPDVSMSDAFNALLRRRSPIREMTAIDSMNAYDPGTIAWVRGSLRPEKEILKPGYMERFRRLIEEQPNSVMFYPADFTDPDDMADFDQVFSGYKAEIVSMLTVGYQQTTEGLQDMFDRAMNYLTDDGVLIFQDFAYSHKKTPTLAQDFKFYKDWQLPYGYVTYIYDKKKPEAGFQEVMRSGSSRCTSIQLDLGRLAASGLTW